MEPELSDLERRVLAMSAVPTAESEIAEQLDLEVWEAKQLIRQVWAKIGVRNIAEARARAQEHRLD
jgi:DNA-binding CsgD family transcriptional regulator